MYRDQKIIVVMPAYNAAQTLRKTYDEVMDQKIVDLVILVDDGSSDETVAIARKLPNTIVHVHNQNRGYYRYGASGLPVYAKTHSRYGFDDWKRTVSLHIGVQNIRRLCP